MNVAQISDTLDLHLKPELEERKRRARRREFESVLAARRGSRDSGDGDDDGEETVPRHFTAASESDISLR